MSTTNPHKKGIEELEQLVQQYPYVALYRTLLTKKSKTEKRANFNELLKQTAFYSPNRKQLYHYLNTEQKKKSKAAEKVETVDLPKEVAKVEEKVKSVEISVEPEKVQAKKPKSIEKQEAKVVEERKATEEILIETKEEAILDENKIVSKEEENVDKADSLPIIEKQKLANEEHSFVDWLNFLDGEESTQIEDNLTEQVIKNDELVAQLEQHQAAVVYEAGLNKAIAKEEAKQESIELSEADSKEVNRLAEGSITLKQSTVTETLAKIMLMQGKINDAIAMYEALSLKYPEKSNYFAAQIEKIKK